MSTCKRSSADDSIRSTVNYSENLSSTSSQDQSPFLETQNTSPVAGPLTNNHSYQMDPSNNPPHSSGPPRTNAKGVYDNTLQSSNPNFVSFGQSNAENYPIDPDFQLQPHLASHTGLLSQQSKRVPELYPVDKYNSSRGSIAANMNTNYFSSNKSYPEPKIIEYDLEETSTDSSPQHTSSLYSESTDQDSESIHPNNAYSKLTFNKPTECHITKESKTLLSPNQDYPVPSQFADLNLNRRNSVDDHQHSVLHSAYNQVDDGDIIEDIPLSDNTNQNEIDSNLENQENPELQTNKQIRGYYANTNEFSPNNYFCENENDLNPYKSKTNSVSYNIASSSDRTNYSQFNNGPYFSQPNTLAQPSSLNSSSVEPQSKPLYSYNNTEILSYQQKSPNIQNYNDCIQPRIENQQNKSEYQNTPPINNKLQSDNINSNNTIANSILNQSTSEAQILNDQNNFQSINSGTSNLNQQQNLPTADSINQQLVYSSSKSSVSEFSNDISSITNQQFTLFNPSLVSSTQSVGPITSAVISTLKSSTAAEIKENHNEPPQPSDDQVKHLFNLSNATKNSPANSVKQDSINTLNSEFNITPSQSPNDNLVKNQQEIMASPTSSIYNKSNESQNDYIKSPSPISIPNFTQSNNVINSNNTTSQIETNYNQLSPNQFTSQQSTNGSIHTSSNQFSNNFTHSIINQNVTTASVVGQSVGNYFNLTNTSNQSVFHHQSPNMQQNINTQGVTPSIISSFPLTDESKNSTMFSNIQNNPGNSLSLVQQSMSTKKELDITESVKLDSNMASEETVKLNSTDSVEYATAIQSNNLNVDSLQNTEIKNFSSQVSDILPPNNQFSNMAIDNQQNLPVSQSYGQEQITSTSYFSKGTSFNEESHSNAFQNLSSTLHDTSYSTFELSGDNDSLRSLKNKQKESLLINPDQPITQSLSTLPMNNESILNEQSIQSGTDQCPPLQLSSNKVTSNSILPQIFSNQPKPGAFSTPSSITNQFTTPLPSNQPISNTVPNNLSHVNQSSPQLFNAQSNLDSVSSTQLTSNLFTKQSFNNQPAPITGSSASLSTNQLPTQMFNNQPTADTAQPLHSTSNPYPTNQFNNQPMPFEVTPNASIVNQFPHKMFDSQPKIDTVPLLSSVVNQYPSKTSNNQSTPSNTWPPVSSTTINQFPLPQPPTSGYPLVKSFNNQSTQNSIPLVSTVANQLPSRMFGNLPKSGTPPLKSMENQYPIMSSSNQSMLNTVPPILSTANHVPDQMFSNQFKSDLFSPQTTSNQYQYPPQSLNNQPMSNNMVPPIFPAVNKLPLQVSSNQPILGVVSSTPSTMSQILPQSFNNKPTPNQIPPQMFSSQPLSQPLNTVPKPNIIPTKLSTQNQFSSHMISGQPGLDANLSNKQTASQYPPQPLSNQPLTSVPLIQQVTTNQFPMQSLSTQSKPINFPFYQSSTTQYPSQPFINQPGQQVLPISNNRQPLPSNHLYNQTNSAQLAHNQFTSHPTLNQPSQLSIVPLSNQTNDNVLSQPTATNLSTNSSVNQQTQRQMLPPNPLSANNYYNQGNENIKQPFPPSQSQNIQLPSKECPQQNNIGHSSQINYQQPNSVHGQQGYHNQQQDMYRPQQNASVVQQGFTKSWGLDNVDLLKSRDVLPGDGVQPAEIKLPQGYANCDNCSPDIFRCTLNKFPSSKNLLDKCRLPLGILLHPYKDLSCLTVIQCDTITRCRNCRSYINPFVQFIDNAHWKCNLCYRVNDLPGEFQIDPYTKTLGDPSRRPEIQNATIEYIASQDYMVRPPQPVLYLFLLDVSQKATMTGYLEIVCERILNKIMTNDIPGDSRTNIGFITYDSSVHFYQIANNDGGRPKQLIVSDISDIFLPLPDGLMVNLEENKSAIKDLLTSLPNLYRESYDVGCALGAALQTAFKILAPRGGRVTVFQACLPNCGPGSLQARDDGTAQTGDRVQHMTPSTDFYKKLALECSAEQIAVDLFFVSSQYLDIATISGISKYSAGCVHNFSQFDVNSPTVVTRFINCFDRYLTRKIGFEALLRLRCTRGVSIHSFHGNFFVRSSDLLMLPNVNPDNAYGMQLSIDESLDGVSVVCFQAALLYTSSNAERRIRVHTLCIPVTDNLSDVFHNADQQAIACLIAKMAVDRSTEKSLSDAREAFFNAISDSLSAFKVGCSSYGGVGTMLSPLSLKVFPLYILAMLKHSAFRTNQPTRLDDRMFSMCQMKSLPLNSLIQYIYPDLYPIHTLDEQPKIDYGKLTGIPLPPVLQLSAERIESNGIYLMDDSDTLTIFIGHRCSDLLIQQLFGYINLNSMPELITTITELDSTLSYLLRNFISYLQHFKPYPLPIEVIKDNGPHKIRFYSRLVEDKFELSLSYYEFLQRLSQQVR